MRYCNDTVVCMECYSLLLFVFRVLLALAVRIDVVTGRPYGSLCISSMQAGNGLETQYYGSKWIGKLLETVIGFVVCNIVACTFTNLHNRIVQFVWLCLKVCFNPRKSNKELIGIYFPVYAIKLRGCFNDVESNNNWNEIGLIRDRIRQMRCYVPAIKISVKENFNIYNNIVYGVIHLAVKKCIWKTINS